MFILVYYPESGTLVSLVIFMLPMMFKTFIVLVMLELFAPFELFVLIMFFMFLMFLARSPVFGNISISVIKFVGWILAIIWSGFFFSRGASVQRLF